MREGGTSLVVQWVRLHSPNAGGPGSIPGQGTRSHMHAATKSLYAASKKSTHCYERSRVLQLRPGSAKKEKINIKKKKKRMVEGTASAKALWRQYAR